MSSRRVTTRGGSSIALQAWWCSTAFVAPAHWATMHVFAPAAPQKPGQHLCLWEAQPCKPARTNIAGIASSSTLVAGLRTKYATTLLGCGVLFLLLARLLGPRSGPPHLRAAQQRALPPTTSRSTDQRSSAVLPVPRCSWTAAHLEFEICVHDR